MNILLIGGGGREYALLKALKKNPEVETVYALPGNAGMDELATCVSIGPTDIDGIVEFAAAHPIDYAVVAQDDPLVLGLVDRLAAINIPSFGPDQKAAQIEGSKIFAKVLMERYGIPTAKYRSFDDSAKALQYLAGLNYPAVVKADGLALGKGVIIAQSEAEAREAVLQMMEGGRFGASGSRVVIEEFLEGPEVTVLCFTDGETLVPMISSMDHKRIGEDDTGLNTGGMGVIAPNPFYTDAVAAEAMETIYLPTIRAMAEEGCPFKGCLYFGLMLCEDGPKVIEYNCRFGDPETQAILPLLESDLLTIMQATTEGNLADVEVKFSPDSSCCVIMASKGYPEAYEKGFSITVPDRLKENVSYAGVRNEGGGFVSAGGRVLACTAVAPTLEEAVRDAYAMVETIEFQPSYYRRDIGKRALMKDGRDN